MYFIVLFAYILCNCKGFLLNFVVIIVYYHYCTSCIVKIKYIYIYT